MNRLSSSNYYQLISIPSYLSRNIEKKHLIFALFMLAQWVIHAQPEADILSSDVEVTCTGIVVHFSGNPNWPTHHWDFGDGTPIVSGGPELNKIDHVYNDINPFATPITARHSLDQSFWFDEQIIFPGIFVGTGCGSTRLVSNLVSAGILPQDQLDNQTLFIFGDLEVDIPYIFNACTLKKLPAAS